MIRSNENIRAIDAIKRDAAQAIRFSWRGMKQIEISCRTGLHQGEVTDIIAGRLARFSLAKLVMVLVVMGRKPTITLAPIMESK